MPRIRPGRPADVPEASRRERDAALTVLLAAGLLVSSGWHVWDHRVEREVRLPQGCELDTPLGPHIPMPQ